VPLHNPYISLTRRSPGATRVVVMFLLDTVLIKAAAATAVATVAVTGAVAAGGHSHTLVSSQSTRQVVGRIHSAPCASTVWAELPASLQSDLIALKGLPPAEIKAGLKKIYANAVAGDYGPGVERFVVTHEGDGAKIFAHLPAQLQSDLEAAAALPTDERHAAFLQIAVKALDGDYGSRVEKVAEALKAHWLACGGMTGSASSSLQNS
jgi:hypothetical protein